jgi:hypothetical protein
MRTGKEIICDVCGKPGARIRRVARTYGKEVSKNNMNIYLDIYLI